VETGLRQWQPVQRHQDEQQTRARFPQISSLTLSSFLQILAQYKHLPIYKLTYDLLNEITKRTRHFPKDFKYSLGAKLRDETVELVVFIYKANSSRETRSDFVRAILERLQIIELLLRHVNGYKARRKVCQRLEWLGYASDSKFTKLLT
jgi:hypothetical protein